MTTVRHWGAAAAATPFPTLERRSIAVNTFTRQIAVGDEASGSVGTPLAMIAVRFFDARAPYVLNDIVLQGGILYKAKGAIAPGAFNASQWSAIDNTASVLLDGSRAMTGALTLYGDPSQPQHATDKQYVDAQDAIVSAASTAGDALRVAKAGDTMSGHLALPTGPAAADAVRKDYVDAADAVNATAASNANTNANNRVSKAGDTMTGDLTIGPKTYAALNLVGTSSSGPIITGKIDATHMWTTYVAEGVTGDIAFYRTNAAGAPIDAPLRLSKATGILTAAVGLNVPGPTTLAGDMTMSKASPTLKLDATSDTSKLITGSKSSVTHWAMALGEGTPADNFILACYNNAGTLIGTPLSINRTTQVASVASLASAGAMSSAGNFSLELNDASVIWKTAAAAQRCSINWNEGFPAFRFFEQASQTYVLAGNWTFPAICSKPGGGAFADSSDARIKNVEGDYTRGLDEVLALRPVTYTFKGNDTPDPVSATPGPPSDEELKSREGIVVPFGNSNHYHQAVAGTRFAGLIAQEVEAVLPEMVTPRAGYIDGEKVTDLRDLDTTPLIFALINSIKTLAARVEALEGAPP